MNDYCRFLAEWYANDTKGWSVRLEETSVPLELSRSMVVSHRA